MPKIPASERDAFYEKRRSELVDAALRVWAEGGVGATSVAAIAEAAGISKGTFYLYFESKQALLEEVFRRNSLIPVVQELAADLADASFEEAVHGFVRAAWRHLCERRELVLVALRELPSELERARQVVERVIVPANQLIESYLREHVGEKRASEINLILAGRGLVGMVVFTFVTQELLGAGRALPLEDETVTSTLAELFLRGVTGSGPEARA